MCCMDFEAFVPYQPYYFKYGSFQVKTYYDKADFKNYIQDIYYVLFDEPKNDLIQFPSACTDIMLFQLEDGSRKHLIFNMIKESQVICFGKRIKSMLSITLFPGTYKRILSSLLLLDDILMYMGYFNKLEDCFLYGTFQKMEQFITAHLKTVLPSRCSYISCIQRLIELYIKDECSINIESISNELGFSSRNLRYFFDDHIGVSPKEFCELLRFQKSLILIEEKYERKEKVLLSKIAIDCGYYDQAHMSKKMKKYTGLSPSMIIRVIEKGL